MSELLMKIERGERLRRLEMVTEEAVTPTGIRFLRTCQFDRRVRRPPGNSSRNAEERLFI